MAVSTGYSSQRLVGTSELVGKRGRIWRRSHLHRNCKTPAKSSNMSSDENSVLDESQTKSKDYNYGECQLPLSLHFFAFSFALKFHSES
jgi:hypothetical protein